MSSAAVAKRVSLLPAYGAIHAKAVELRQAIVDNLPVTERGVEVELLLECIAMFEKIMNLVAGEASS